MSGHPLSAADERCFAAGDDATWAALAGARLFLTGGTGFVGAWLIAALEWARRDRGLELEVVALTRDAGSVLERLPWLALLPWLELRAGDVRELASRGERFTHVIVGAASADADLVAREPLTVIETIVNGCSRALSLARDGNSRILLLSSGAVYGKQPLDLERIPEDFTGAPDPLSVEGAYGEAKRAAEAMVMAAAGQHALHCTVARLFAFVGPWLPLDRHFAAGNFVRDGLRGGPIVVAGDGTPTRSYLYGADLAIWLLTLLARGRSCRAYNVGAERSVSVSDLARLTAATFDPAPDVEVRGPAAGGGGGFRYVPSTWRARDELGVSETVDLEEALARTVAWERSTGDAMM